MTVLITVEEVSCVTTALRALSSTSHTDFESNLAFEHPLKMEGQARQKMGRHYNIMGSNLLIPMLQLVIMSAGNFSKHEQNSATLS